MKKGGIALAVVAGLIAVAYFGVWIYSAKWFTAQVEKLYAKENPDVIFLGQKPVLGNFPFVPEISYDTGFRSGDVDILFPVMTLRGYPIFGAPITVDFPQGLSLGGIVDPAIWTVDSLKINVLIPYKFPNNMTAESLTEWRDHDGKIDVQNYDLIKGPMISSGKGYLFLDEQLQPVVSFESAIKGYEEFVYQQRDAGLIEPFPAAMAVAVLNGMARQNAATGEKSLNINVSVQNQILRVGPVQVLALPMIRWDRRTMPAPHQ